MSDILQVIETPAILTIYEVAQQAAIWQEQLKTTMIDCWSLEALAEFDAAGLQLLIAMSNAVNTLNQDRKLSIKPPVNPDIAHWLMPRLSLARGNDNA
ncbi:hypothetical protein [Alishewanella sp. SMS8]|uniref:hypothetical protein n=1 Tax=Alishewanella sp. SMS8 TaxID=2994676 RepID=UPI00274175ED|nr:hypothetical protein [Alishewanella sp. SMS8]MDP5460383.1 hypothetical protein [Alishewanella sp. SMS8]